MTKEAMLRTLIRYATKDLRHQCSEGTGLLSALVNLVDTARENPEKFVGRQWEREIEIAEFLFAHDPDGLTEKSSEERQDSVRRQALKAKFVARLAEAGFVAGDTTDEELGVWKAIIDDLLYGMAGLSYEQGAVLEAQALFYGLSVLTVMLTDVDNPVGLGCGHQEE